MCSFNFCCFYVFSLFVWWFPLSFFRFSYVILRCLFFSFCFYIIPANREMILDIPSYGFGPLGIEVEKQGFPTAWLIRGQKFAWQHLKSGSSLLTFRDPSAHVCQINLWMAVSGDLDFGSCSIYQAPCFLREFEAPWGWAFSKHRVFAGIRKMGPGHFSKISNFQNFMFHPFRMSSY